MQLFVLGKVIWLNTRSPQTAPIDNAQKESTNGVLANDPLKVKFGYRIIKFWELLEFTSSRIK